MSSAISAAVGALGHHDKYSIVTDLGCPSCTCLSLWATLSASPMLHGRGAFDGEDEDAGELV
jgi:hypothetical protein